ncbi:MAG: hypothetical protein NZM12_10660, partial [Steroidobacteraceae bacterium]|nr:hypothetical protein [Steroidobacteraceae bacterium]MDW8257824.1 apolipoprotein N-acyltransferase [Gammaproteobacteria bacterium]
MNAAAGWRGFALAIVAGLALAAAFAPLQWWWFSVLSPAALIWLWQKSSPRRAAWLGAAFAAAMFGAGTYWLYISVHVFGQAPLWLALFLMAALVAIMSAYYALLGYLAVRWRPRAPLLFALAWVPGLWALIEWLRGWLLTGFAWLSLGYAHIDTPLAGFAPLGGVYLISLLSLFSAGALAALVSAAGTRRRALLVLLGALPFAAGALLSG